jgi:hypothetical protein
VVSEVRYVKDFTVLKKIGIRASVCRFPGHVTYQPFSAQVFELFVTVGLAVMWKMF